MRKFGYTETARRLGISRRTLFRLVSEGKLRRVVISPRRVYIDPESLKELLGEQLYAELFGSEASE